MKNLNDTVEGIKIMGMWSGNDIKGGSFIPELIL
jgi:hypothetical protein